ncbi:peptidoglycan DD-metalloendopeptidase family protein [bacterium]|nr:peptidoglycan DD-metalloendopeptidase family protein [bacterium]
MSQERRKYILHFGAWTLVLLLAICSPRAASVRESLDQMATIEKQIDELRRNQWEERNRLLKSQGTLQSIEKRLGERAALKKEGEQFLNEYQAQAGREAGRIDAQMEEGLGRLRAARRGLALSAAAMLHAGPSAGASQTDRLGLLLLWRNQHQTATITSRQLLRLESRRAQLLEGRTEAQQITQENSIFGSLSEQELSERHKELANQIEDLQGTIGQSEREIKELAGRREELRKLMARLVEQEAKATPAPTPAPTQAPVIAAAEQRLVTAVRQQDQGVAPVENEPLVSRDSQTPANGDGTRQVFWRAEPIGVRALGSGRIVFAEPFAGYRNLVIIDHGGGWRTLYGNLTRCSVRLGAQVAVGDTLGEYQSSEGASRAEPFWLEVRQGVTAVRPDQWPALPTQWEHNLFTAIGK